MTPQIDSAACEIIPVLDLMHGQIVRGIAGRRESYQPIQSQLLDSARPLEVANTFQSQLGLERVYLADLDAIQHDQPDWDTLDALVAAGHRLLVDAGPRNTDRAVRLIEHQVDSVVAGLETLDRPELIAELVEAVGNRQLVLSLDLKNGQPMIDAGTWPDPTPLGLATMAVEMGIQRMIVLDLAGVGTQDGPPTLELCRQIRRRFDEIELITGGGIRDLDDISAAANAGVDAVLVASALHDGSLLETT